MSNNVGKIIGGIVLSPFFLIALGIAYCEANKAYWDHQVKLMCEKDGGVTVFENVEITKEEYEKLLIPVKKRAKSSDLYYRVSLEDVVLHETPRVSKGGQTIVRQSDGKVLGLQIIYGRSRGDFAFTSANQTSFSCSGVKGININLTGSVFSIKGE